MLYYMLTILFIYALSDMMKMQKINSQIEYVFVLIISLIFCFSILIYYFYLPRNRISENIFIYLFFVIIKFGGTHDIPKFLELKKGY